jgi:hypothetical protein
VESFVPGKLDWFSIAYCLFLFSPNTIYGKPHQLLYLTIWYISSVSLYRLPNLSVCLPIGYGYRYAYRWSCWRPCGAQVCYLGIHSRCGTFQLVMPHATLGVDCCMSFCVGLICFPPLFGYPALCTGIAAYQAGTDFRLFFVSPSVWLVLHRLYWAIMADHFRYWRYITCVPICLCWIGDLLFADLNKIRLKSGIICHK